jgi:hypothetical protein
VAAGFSFREPASARKIQLAQIRKNAAQLQESRVPAIFSLHSRILSSLPLRFPKGKPRGHPDIFVRIRIRKSRKKCRLGFFCHIEKREISVAQDMENKKYLDRDIL